MLAIHAGLLIDGSGAVPLENVTVLVDGDRIAAIGKRTEIPLSPGTEVIDFSGKVLIPGFVDCHTHLTGLGLKRDPRFPGRGPDPESWLTLRAVARLRDILRAGITTARVLGEHDHLDFITRRAIEEGLIPGPRILAAGVALRSSAGHGHMAYPFNGEKEIRQAIRENVVGRADVTKLFVSGGCADLHTRLDVSYYTREEIVAAVDESHRAGLPVAIHAKGGEGARWAIEAGVQTVEHGYLLTKEDFALMRQHDVWLGATLINVLYNRFHTEDTSPAVPPHPITAAKFRHAAESLLAGFPIALEMGVKYVVSTDAQPERLHFLMECLVEHFGVKEMDALMAMTSRAAEVCGVAADAGRLEPGKFADMVVLDGNPLDNIRAVRKLHRVVKGGKAFQPECAIC